jgi:16S rRNA processing protein RimM
VGKPYGLGGAFFVSGRDQILPNTIRKLYFGNSPERAMLILEFQSSRMQGGRPILICRDFNGRDRADQLKGQLIWCRRDEIQIDEQDEYIWSDLLGKQVLDCEGKLIGTIISVQNYGASDIVELENNEARLLIPFVAAYFDMSFSVSDPALRLQVPGETFDEAWEK